MNPESEKPLRLFINPFSLWTDFAFKTGEAILATAHAAALRANGAAPRVDGPKVAVLPAATAPSAKVAVIPAADAPKVAVLPAATVPSAKVAVIPAADAPRPKAKPASKPIRFKAARAKLRSKATGKRRARR